MDYYICPDCSNRALAKVYEDDTIYVCDECGSEFSGEDTYSGGIKFNKIDTDTIEEKVISETTDTYKNYKIVSDGNIFKIITPDGIEDFETDTIDQAKSWIDNKSSIKAIDEITKIFPSARKLSYSLIDKYITYSGQAKLDPDNTFLVKFKTKRERQQGEKLAKSKGFIVIERTDDDYNMSSKTPFWTFFSINGDDRWLNESLIAEDSDADYIYKYEPFNENEEEFTDFGEGLFNELSDAIAYCKDNPEFTSVIRYTYKRVGDDAEPLPIRSDLVWTEDSEDITFESLRSKIYDLSESLELPQGNPIRHNSFGKYKLCLERQTGEDITYAVVGYNSMVAISKKIFKDLNKAENLFKKVSYKINKLKENGEDYIDALNNNSDKIEKIILSVGKDLSESMKISISETAEYSSWTDVYDKFNAIVDKYFPDEAKIEAEVDNLYSKHKGDEIWDLAYSRWIETAGDDTDFIVSEVKDNKFSIGQMKGKRVNKSKSIKEGYNEDQRQLELDRIREFVDSETTGLYGREIYDAIGQIASSFEEEVGREWDRRNYAGSDREYTYTLFRRAKNLLKAEGLFVGYVIDEFNRLVRSEGITELVTESKSINEDTFGYKSGNRYYGGLPSEGSDTDYAELVSNAASEKEKFLAKYGVKKEHRSTSFDSGEDKYTGNINGHNFEYIEGSRFPNKHWASKLVIDNKEVDIYKSKSDPGYWATIDESFSISDLIDILINDRFDAIVFKKSSEELKKIPLYSFTRSQTYSGYFTPNDILRHLETIRNREHYKYPNVKIKTRLLSGGSYPCIEEKYIGPKDELVAFMRAVGLKSNFDKDIKLEQPTNESKSIKESSLDDIVTIGIYGDEVRKINANSVDDIAAYFIDRDIEVIDKSGDMDYGWDMELRGNPRDIYVAVNNIIPGYSCSSAQEFVDRYRLDESLTESSNGPKYVTKDIINKTNSQKLKDAYDEGELEVLINGDVWYTEQCPDSLHKELKSEMKRLYPNIKYLYSESINEGSYDFGEYKKQAASVEDRIAKSIGAYSRDMYKPYDSSGYILTRQDADPRFTKQNFCLHPFGYNVTKDYESDMKNMIRSIGGKYIVSSYGIIHFYIDETPFADAKTKEQDEIDTDFSSRKAEYEAQLNAEDIEKFKPNNKVLNKLQDYRSRGSKVNVKAIKNMDKLLTYYYAACIMDWKDLKYDCEEVIPLEYKDIKNAISFRCDSQEDLMDSRDKDTQFIASKFNRVTTFLHTHSISYKFSKRQPNRSELELDRRNGRCWTLGYTLELSDGTKIEFADHTNEGGGTYGYSVNGGNIVGKREAEDRLIQIIKDKLHINESNSIKEYAECDKYRGSLKEELKEIDRKYFKTLETDGTGMYFILSDNNFVSKFYADSDEEAIKRFREDTITEDYMPDDDDYDRIDRNGSDEERLLAAITYQYGVGMDKAREYEKELSDQEKTRALKYYDLRMFPPEIRLQKMNESLNEDVTFSNFVLDSKGKIHSTLDLLKGYTFTTDTTFICPHDEYSLVEIYSDTDGQHVLQCTHCQTQYAYEDDNLESFKEI